MANTTEHNTNEVTFTLTPLERRNLAQFMKYANSRTTRHSYYMSIDTEGNLKLSQSKNEPLIMFYNGTTGNTTITVEVSKNKFTQSNIGSVVVSFDENNPTFKILTTKGAVSPIAVSEKVERTPVGLQQPVLGAHVAVSKTKQLTSVLPAVSYDLTRAPINGVHVTATTCKNHTGMNSATSNNDTVFDMVGVCEATTSYIATQQPLQLTSVPSGDDELCHVDVTIPTFIMDSIKAKTVLSFNNTLIRVMTPKARAMYSSTLTEITGTPYPDLAKLHEPHTSDNQTHITLPVKETLDTISVVRGKFHHHTGDKPTVSALQWEQIKLDWENNTMSVRRITPIGHSEEHENFSHPIPFETRDVFLGARTHSVYNANYLTDLLTVAHNNNIDTITLTIPEAVTRNTAVGVTPTGEQVRMLLMPIRTT